MKNRKDGLNELQYIVRKIPAGKNHESDAKNLRQKRNYYLGAVQRNNW